MKILALIPARGGSKRLPGKNIRPLGGRPLIGWTIHAAQESGCCTNIVVSTDDPDIAQCARDHGVSVPHLRPAELATDTASSLDMALHVLDDYERQHGPVEGLLLLQPTSPFRKATTISQGVNLFSKAGGNKPVVSVSPATNHPSWCFRSTGESMQPFLGWDAIGQRSQDLEPAWTINGALYIISPERLRSDQSFLTLDTLPLHMNDPIESIDIDTPFDWAMAETALK